MIMRILNFGSLNIDYVYRVDTFVKPGETRAAHSLSKFAGGKGLNQSLAMARAGLAVFHAGRIGPEGAFLVETLRRGNVDTTMVEQIDTPTGHAIIQVDDSGQNCILLFGGANQNIDEPFADRVIGHFGPGDFCILQNEISCLDGIMRKAHAAGMRIALNPSPFTARLMECPLEMVDIFIMNEIEASEISGEKDPVRAAQTMTARYPGATIIITLGEEGSLCMQNGSLVRQKAYRVNAVDTTAAGDTFLGYCIAGIAEGMDIAGSLDLASRASAICVTRPGASDSVPFRQEVALFAG